MAAGVDTDEDLIALSLDRLILLFDEVEQMKTTVGALREQQVGAWPAIASVQTFVRDYCESLRVTTDDLDAIQATIGHFHQALLDSAQSLRDLDQDIKDRLMRLAERLPETLTSSTRSGPSRTGEGGLGGHGSSVSSAAVPRSAPRPV